VKERALKTVVKGAGYTAAGMLISKFMTYFYRVAVARLLGPDAYGQLSIGIAVLSFVNAFAMLSVGVAVNKYVPEYLEDGTISDIKGAVLSSLSITVPLSALAGVLMFLFAEPLATQVFSAEQPQKVADVIRVLAFVPVFGNMQSVVETVFSAYRRVKYQVIDEMIVRNIAQVLITVALILNGVGVAAAAFGWLGATVVALIVGTYWMEKHLGPILTSDAPANLQRRKIIRFSAPLVLGSAAGTLLSHIDTFMLSYYLTETQVGFYNAALPTAALIQLPYIALRRLTMPSLSALKENFESDVPQTVKTLTRWALMTCLPLFGGVVLFPGESLRLLFGGPYVSASTALVILAAGRIVDVATGYMSEVLSAYGETKILFKNSFVQLAINIGLNIALIPFLGIVGAALATAGTTSALNIILVAEAYYVEGIQPFTSRLVKPFAALIASITAVYAATQMFFEFVPVWAMIPAGISFVALYLSILVVFGSFYEEDAQIIESVGRKLGSEEKGEKLGEWLAR
jgi:O-antigen/teichoic acid export membrane protein